MDPVVEGKIFVFFSAALISAVGMKNKPKIIDLTKKLGTAERLTEARINCALEDKVDFIVRFSS